MEIIYVTSKGVRMTMKEIEKLKLENEQLKDFRSDQIVIISRTHTELSIAIEQNQRLKSALEILISIVKEDRPELGMGNYDKLLEG